MTKMPLLFLLTLLPLLFSCSDPKPLQIGFVGGISGRVADLGISGRNGVILATEEINLIGGINGRRVELLIRDDQQTPEIAKKVVKELLDEKVVAIIGHMTSAMSISTVPLINEAETVMISPTSTTTLLSNKDDYFFRVVATTDVYTKAVAGHFADQKIKKIAVIYDKRNLAYTENWLRDFTKSFEQRNGKVIEAISFTSGSDIHFSDIANRILATNPEAVISIANALDTAMFSQQLRKTGSILPLAACEWASTEQLIELGGPAVDGLVVDQFFDRENQLPSYQKFRSNYIERFNKEPGFASVAGYDAAKVLFVSLLKVSDYRKLKKTMLSIESFPGVQGQFKLNAFGDADRPTFLAKVENGKFKRIK